VAVQRSVIITDPVHQVMSFGTEPRLRKVLKKVIDTPMFQRLRRISQLGLAQNVFPGATHTRFVHGLGAAYLALKALAHLEERHGRGAIEPRLEVIIAALLHDVGHGPFSHSFEHVLEDLKGDACVPLHEDWTRAAIELEGSDIRRALVDSDLNVDKVAASFRSEGNEPLPKYLRQLVSSQIDVDRMDYLVRDSHFAGVALGRVDIYYLINCLTIIEHDGKAVTSLGVEEKGVKAYEGFALARHLMNRTVYYHRAVKVFEFMMEELLRRVISNLELLDTDAELQRVVPRYLRAVAHLRASRVHSVEEVTAKHWEDYFALSEADIWHLVATLANSTSEGVPGRIGALAKMILTREKLPYWGVFPGTAAVLREKLDSDGFRANEDYHVIDLKTTVYKQHKDQVFVMLRTGEAVEIATVSEILAMLRDREERTSLLVALEPRKARALEDSGVRVRAIARHD
jgi:uncharacterized protein